ncbi:MAG TPA: hypothetical protein VGL39_22310 [Jatrophihabitantaceae bacterium]
MLPMLGSLDEQHLSALGAVPELAYTGPRAWLAGSTRLPPTVVNSVLNALRGARLGGRAP